MSEAASAMTTGSFMVLVRLLALTMASAKGESIIIHEGGQVFVCAAEMAGGQFMLARLGFSAAIFRS